jgi:voltage-gated potassium channel
MQRSHNRFLRLIGALLALLLVMSLLYMLGMQFFEGKPRTFWQALQWAAGTTSTTGYGGDTSWQHPVMVVFVVFAQFMGVTLIFMVLPIFLIPFLEERFETKLPNESASAKDHVVIFDFGPAVETLVAELAQAHIPIVIIDEDEADARHLLAQGHHVIFGNLDEGVLEKSNLKYARSLIVNSSDDRNAATILAARQLGYTGEILALVEDPYHRQPMILAGASGAFTPRHVLGAALAARASQKISPMIAGTQQLGHQLQVADVRIARDSLLGGRTLHETGLDHYAGVTVIGQWTGGKFTTPAMPGMRLDPGGILCVVGDDERIRGFLDLHAGLRWLRRDGPFLIAGGGEVGRKVAELLNDAGEKTLIIDAQPGPGVDVVGNVLNTQTLQQAELDNAQAVILALSADATTLFTMVIIKDLAPDVPVIARVNHAENVDRLYGAGADFALSISEVSGQLLAWQLLGKESVAEDSALQVVKVSARGLENYHPKEVDLREKTRCTVVAVERDGAMLGDFSAEFRLKSDDGIYICGSTEAIQHFYREFPRGNPGDSLRNS